MKIAFVSQPIDAVLPPFQNSIGIWTYKVAQILAQHHEVAVYSRRNRSLPFQMDESGVDHRMVTSLPARLWQMLEKRSARQNSEKLPIFASPVFYFEYALQVALDLRKRGCDIVHIMNFSQYVPVIRAFNPGVKIVLHMHGQWLNQLDRDTIEKRLAPVDLIVGCSEYITGKVRKRFPHFSSRCRTVYNGVDVAPLGLDETPGEKRNGAPGKPRRVLFVGRISPEKGIHVLLEAFSQIADRQPDVHLDILGPVGILPLEYLVALSDDPRVRDLARFYSNPNENGNPGSYYDRIQAQITPQMADRVHFIGFVPHSQLDPYYRGAHVFVNASFSEAFPIPIPEAMGRGLPVVASQVGGIPEAVIHGETGFLVEPGNTEQLASELLSLLEDEPLRQTMAAAAFTRAVECFSWPAVAGQMEIEYAGLGAQK